MDKVLPYEEILPKELYKDLLKTFLSLLDPKSKPSGKSKPRITNELDEVDFITVDPPTTMTKEINLTPIDSKIITDEHVKLISAWVD